MARALGRLTMAGVKTVLLLILLGVVAALSGWFTMRYLIVGEEVVVPKVVGMSLRDADALARSRGLFLHERSSRYDETVRENEVLEQDPAPGQSLKLHKRIHVVVSLGSRRLTIPDLKGLTLPQARVRLSEEGLELAEVVRARTNEVVEGAVVAHDPPAGSEYFKDSPIKLLVSAGPEEIAFVMPDLIGRNVDDVVRFMQDAGLRLGDIVEEEYEGLDPGTITSQQPRAGSRVGSHDIITLSVVQGIYPEPGIGPELLPLVPNEPAEWEEPS